MRNWIVLNTHLWYSECITPNFLAYRNNTSPVCAEEISGQYGGSDKNSNCFECAPQLLLLFLLLRGDLLQADEQRLRLVVLGLKGSFTEAREPTANIIFR